MFKDRSVKSRMEIYIRDDIATWAFDFKINK